MGSTLIILASFSEEARVLSAIEAGGSSYLLKNVSPGDLVKAIQSSSRRQSKPSDTAESKEQGI